MSITRDEVAHLARLSRLAPSDEKRTPSAPRLNKIIPAGPRVREGTAGGIPPTSHALPLTNVYRDDEPRPCLTAAQSLSQAPAVEQQRLRGPRILAEDGR